MIDIFMTCFTAMRSRDVSDATRQYCKVTDDKEDQKVQVSIKFESEWEVNIKLITVEYVRTNFILDFLACVPGILTGEDILWLYPFKVLRLTRIFRIIIFLEKLSSLLKQRFMKHQIFIDNLYKVLETIFILVFCLHALGCCFIAIGHMAPTDSVNDSWIYKRGLYDDSVPYSQIGKRIENKGPKTDQKIYFTACYFVTTSITTIGYGDIYGNTETEKLFIIFLLFAGILIFTIIQQRTRSLIKEPTMKKMSQQAYDDAIDFLFRIDDPCPEAIADSFYEALANYKTRECEKSTWMAFSNNRFFKMLPPRLQEQLVTTTLEKHLDLLNFFFVDHDTGYSTSKAFIRRMITNLQYSAFKFGEPVIKQGFSACGVLFIQTHGLTVLGCKESVRLLDFFENSFIGEFEVIFKQKAERSYIAINKKMSFEVNTQIYFCKPEDFLQILLDFDDFDKFVQARAMRRRAYVRYLENEMQKQIDDCSD